MSDNPWQRAEDDFFSLKRELAAGRLTREEFAAALQGLMIQDEQGGWWTLGAESGRWLMHDGQTWVEAPPPIPSPALHCTACGSAIPPGNRFCSSCGTPAQGPFPGPPRSAVAPMPAAPPQVVPARPYRAPRRGVRPLWMVALGGATLGLVVLAAVALFALRGRPAAVSPTSPAGDAVALATSEPQKLLAPAEFAVTSQNLATAIAGLNRAELTFVRDAQTGGTSAATLDDDLREVAAGAMSVAQRAEALGLTAVAQDGGSDAAGRMAGQYYALARLGYGLVIEAQNLREGLPARTIARADAITTIAEYGARLWHAGITDPGVKGNPFLPSVKDATSIAPVQFLSSNAVTQLKTQVEAGATLQAWLATSQEVVTKTVDLPAPRAPVANPFDASVVKTLTVASEQADADRARQVAAARLALLTANPSPTVPAQAAFAVFKGASVADANQVGAGTVPSFAKGTASALAGQTGVEDLVSTLFELDGQAPPRIGGKTSVKQRSSSVSLSIRGARVTGMMEDIGGWIVEFEVEVAWQTTLVAPSFVMGCGRNAMLVTTTSGSEQLGAGAFVFRLVRQGRVVCRAEAEDLVGYAVAWVDLPPDETVRAATTATPTATGAFRGTPTGLATPPPTSTPTGRATATPTPVAPTPPPVAPIKGRLVVDYGAAQSSRVAAGEALRAGSSRCEPEVAIAPDGAVSGECENKDARPGGSSPYVMTALVAGKADTRSGSFSFTYEVTEISPSLPPPFSDRVTWRIAYSGSGTFTSATEASGTANFSYRCEGTATLRWCGRGGGETSESFAGTVPWSFRPPG